jgi:outer membrane receptor protein involved in Fe transport
MMFIKNRIFLTILLLAVSLVASGQGSIKGRVTESEVGSVVEGANVIIGGLKGTATDAGGKFYLSNIPSGRQTVEVSVLGYQLRRVTIEVKDKETVSLDVILDPSFIEAREVVISATRTEHFINDVPTRVNLVLPGIIRATPALTIDDYLTLVPGINISRSFGIFSHKSNVTMRGLSGKEQARVLVMIDGVPVNKSDGGSVNWNLLDPDMIDRIEVVKGPQFTEATPWVVPLTLSQ